MSKTVIVSGGFDPIHSGHLAYLKAAKALGDRLVVGVNSDLWLIVKKNRFFMPITERLALVRELACVDEAMSFDDADGSAVKLIEQVRQKYPNDDLIFANGGDRTAENIPEMVCKGVQFVFGVGGTDKKNSSSWILSDWENPKIYRPWGHYRVLYASDTVKVKELYIEPNHAISLQRHSYRSEYWHVVQGIAQVHIDGCEYILGGNAKVEIPVGSWHKLSNPADEALKVIELQYGQRCVEEDIERKEKVETWIQLPY